MANFVILTADALRALTPLERQVARRAARGHPLVQRILQTFLRRGGLIPVGDIVAGSADGRAETDHDALIALDADDLIRVHAGHIDIAYPFSAVPTPFRVRLSGGRDRYACCALDALGIAPMIGEPIEIESRCHDCGGALEVCATPDGPGPDAGGVMVWFGKREDERCKVADSL